MAQLESSSAQATELDLNRSRKDAMLTTAHSLMANHKGLLAIDESIPTCNKRFAEAGIPQTEEARQAYRELIVTAPGLSDSVSGLILHDSTIRQKMPDGASFPSAVANAGMISGIKVDAGAHELAGHPAEKVTEGLDGLRGRLAEYAAMGARFAKWRAVIVIGEGIPTRSCLQANAHALARYAGLCQEAGILPIVEPEVLMDGDHDLERCRDVTASIQHAVFEQLHEQGVQLEAVILKPNMVVPGLASPRQVDIDAVAEATVTCLLENVPAVVPGVAFLSGGQPGETASARLSAMNSKFRGRLPWPLTFSFARAIQEPAIGIWAGKPENAANAQIALVHRAACNRAARRGEYTPEMERAKK